MDHADSSAEVQITARLNSAAFSGASAVVMPPRESESQNRNDVETPSAAFCRTRAK